jgi:hypothetical protein
MSTYESDFYRWTQETAELLKQRRFSEIDLAALVEEVEDMGKSQQSALLNRLAVLLAHLLKWQYQPDRRGNSWLFTIEEQRTRIDILLGKNPSLKSKLLDILNDAYRLALIRARKETNNQIIFPPTFEQTGWTWEDVIANDFWPE